MTLWCPATVGMQEELVDNEPERFFKPPTSANGTFSDWLGVFLDTSDDAAVDWSEIAEILEGPVFRTVCEGLLSLRGAGPR